MIKMFEKFNKKSLSKYPDPHKYSNILNRTLWAFHILKEELVIERLAIAQISKFLTDIIEIDTSSQAIRYAINNAPKGFLNKKKNTYKLMEMGRREIIKTNSNLYYNHLINPGETFSSKLFLSDNILSNLKGEVKICDPYVNVRLLDLIIKIDKKCKIKILSSTIENKPEGILKRTLEDLRKEGYQIEIRKYNKSELHDRYILDGGNMWIIGHSIKDLGKKECFIMSVGKDLKIESSNLFDRRWKVSQSI